METPAVLEYPSSSAIWSDVLSSGGGSRRFASSMRSRR
jgi:hypothetical protein